MSDSASSQALEAAIAAMNAGTNVFDVTIVCTTDDHQAAYWMDKLGAGILAKQDPERDRYPLVLAVSEDWLDSGGAGNGLGTLYAVQKASALALARHGIDLMKELESGSISAALYHTAGKGTRLAPLPASENNNKPGVKLPFPLKVSESVSCIPLTVLESVVKQTGIYGGARKGRLSVFWGDQVFIPSVSFTDPPTHHADILCTLIGDAAPSAQEWSDRGLDKYGVIAVLDHGEAAQVEKVSHDVATQMLESLGTIRQVGPSLGSFSVSAAFLSALLSEFKPELEAKTGKLDTDPHFWMPLTLGQDSYVALMDQKGTGAEESAAHHLRMSAFKARLDLKDLGLFGAVNVGRDACWWDYGQLKLYSQNSLLLLEQDSSSADLLRQFLSVSDHRVDSETGDAAVDGASYLFGTRFKSGTVMNSLLTAVTAEEVDTDGAIVVNCAAKKIRAGKGSILYNLVDESDEGITAQAGQVMVAVTNEQGTSTLLQSRMDIDGGTAWKTKLEMNDFSFEQVHASNKDANIREISKKRQEHYDKVVSTLKL